MQSDFNNTLSEIESYQNTYATYWAVARSTAAEPRGNTSKGVEDFNLKAKARTQDCGILAIQGHLAHKKQPLPPP